MDSQLAAHSLACTPAELMYMKTGRVGLSYCRYRSSASKSSVTAGTRDIPCREHIPMTLPCNSARQDSNYNRRGRRLTRYTMRSLKRYEGKSGGVWSVASP